MKVTLDISSIPYQRGVSRYTANLVRALLLHPKVELQVFGFSLRQKDVLEQFIASEKIKPKNVQLWQLPPKFLAAWWYQFSILSPQFFLRPTDIYHAWEEIVPHLSRIPTVVTIHDLAILKYPELAHPSTLYKHAEGWKRIKEQNMHVIAVSKSTRQDIIELLEIDKDRVHLVYEALPAESEIVLKNDELNSIKDKFGLHKPFLLFVGTIEPRKNLNRLIQAWQPLAKEIDLVIAGQVAWEDMNYDSKIKPKILGRVSNKQLAGLYSLAKVFVFPSLYEGFGLPILEAFHYGTPVVTSNISSMPEVAGNAAVLVDPLDTDSIRTGIQTILKENSTQQIYRQQQMKLRTQLFTWESVAEKTVAVYKKAIEDFQLHS